MLNQLRNEEHGIALLFCLIALLILSAIAASLLILSGTDTAVNGNYRTEEIALFAAKSGIYEALDRMQQSNANSIAAQIPTVVPSATGGVLYIINSGSSLTVQPWNLNNPYADFEFCHEGFTIAGMSSAPANVPCSTLPSGSSWYTSVNSTYPWNGTSAALPYEWVRINWKMNSSETYLSGGSSAPTTSSYSVNSSQPASTPVCYNGQAEVLLSTPSGVTPAYTRCEDYQTCAAVSPTVTTPVYLITAFAMTSNGSRQMVQAEVALNPPNVTVSPCVISDPYGFYAYGGACVTGAGSPLQLGGGATVDGFSSANGGTYATTHSASLGAIGSNGSLYVNGSSVTVGGTIYVQSPGPKGNGSNPYTGSCPTYSFSVSGNPKYGNVNASVPLTPPTVSVPAGGATSESVGKSGMTLAPGSYDTITVGQGGTLTLTAPGTYNINCLSVGSAGSNVTISPVGKAVTVNVTGTGCASSPISFGSNTLINNTSGVASNFQINYAGTGTLSMTGGSATYAVINAPNAAVTMRGGADFYGTILANSIDDSGGVNLHFDAADSQISGTVAATATATATGSYNMLSFRAVPY